MQETGKRHKRMGLKATFYRAGKLLVRPLFGCVARVRVVGGENTNCSGGFLLAANHISHFDPFLISLAVRRKIDWMAMAEFFGCLLLGWHCVPSIHSRRSGTALIERQFAPRSND